MYKKVFLSFKYYDKKIIINAKYQNTALELKLLTHLYQKWYSYTIDEFKIILCIINKY